MTNRFLAQIVPDRPEDIPPRAPQAQADAAAEHHGFTSREPTKRRRRQTSDEPTDQLNLRASVSDINVFVEWCIRTRRTNREGFSELVKLIRD